MKTTITIALVALLGLSSCKKNNVEPKPTPETTEAPRVDSLYRTMSIHPQCDSFSVSVNGVELWNMSDCTQALNRTYVFYKNDNIKVHCKGSVWIATGAGGGYNGISCYYFYNSSYPVSNAPFNSGVLTSDLVCTFDVQ